MPTIRILIFRGTGGVYNVDHPHYDEPALVRAGHVGVLGIIENKIIGFHPTPEAAQRAGSEKALLEALRQQTPQQGRLQDDNLYFNRAAELVEVTGGRTTVYMYEVEISEATLNQIRSWYNDAQEALYSFPDNTGNFKDGESNCATFWQRFSIPLPVLTGNIREIIQVMKDEEFDTWSNV